MIERIIEVALVVITGALLAPACLWVLLSLFFPV